MKMLTTDLTLSPDQLFAAWRGQVGPELHEALTAEIERRWPDGMRLAVHLPTDQSTD